MRRSWFSILSSLALAIGVAACGDTGGPLAEPAALAIRMPSADLVPGMSVPLVATLGGVVDRSEVTWTSRDSSTLAIRSGAALARLPGETYLVATDGPSTDSVHVVVHFAGLAADEIGLRIGSGPTASTTTLKGVTVAIEDFADTTYFSRIVASSRPAGIGPTGGTVLAGDTVLFVRFDTRPAVGPMTVAPFTFVKGQRAPLVGDAGVALEILDSTRTRYFVAVKPTTVDVTSLTISPAPSSSAVGAIRGHVSFEAASLAVANTTLAVTPLGDQTVTIFAEFATPVTHAASSVFRMDVAGAPFAGVVTTSGDARLDAGGTVRLQAAGFGVTTAAGARIVPAVSLALPARLGDYATTPGLALPRVEVDFPPDGAAGNPLAGTQKAGRVTITEYAPPTATTWGVIGGTLAVTLEYTGANPHPEFATLVTAPFRLAILPTGP